MTNDVLHTVGYVLLLESYRYLKLIERTNLLGVTSQCVVSLLHAHILFKTRHDFIFQQNREFMVRFPR